MIVALWDRAKLAADTGVEGDAAGGGHSGKFTDPDGHAWEIARNPSWTLGDDGSVKLG